jgi:uncharacterized protein YdhG (YjbR/CyaY superfamily)
MGKRKVVRKAAKRPAAPTTVEGFLAAQPADVRAALSNLRMQIRAAAPGATEGISYGIPVFRRRLLLVGFGATKSHCTFFVMSTDVVSKHADTLAGYELGKGSIQFTPDKPLPSRIVKELVQARLAEIG